MITLPPILPGILERRRRSTSLPSGVPVRPHQRLRFTSAEGPRSQEALVSPGGAPAVQAHRPQPSEDVVTLSRLTASARAWSNRTEGGATRSRLVLIVDSQVGKRLCGSQGLPSTAQCAGRGTIRRRSPSPMEEEIGCGTVAPHGVLLACDGAQNWARSSCPFPPSAAPGSRYSNPMSRDARLKPGSFVRRGDLRGPTPARSQHACKTALNVGGAHTRVGLPPSVSLGATPGSQNSRAV